MLSELAPNPTPEHAWLASALEAIEIELDIPSGRLGRGRPEIDRRAFARAFVLKALTGRPTTKALRRDLVHDEVLRCLCGFGSRVPSLSTFSRVFAEFAHQGLGDRVLERVAKQTLGQAVVMHVARDSTAVVGRERPVLKPKKQRGPKGKPGRKKGVPPKAKVPTRQEMQLEQDAAASILELPRACDTGTKRNSKGHDQHWNGYKFHVDVTDDGMPVSACTTSASVHDSQVAIPLMKLTATRTLAVCYQLMDAGYVGQPILAAAQQLGQVAIIAPKGNKTHKAIPLDPARKQRYGCRNAVERFFSDLKDNRGGSDVRVKGHPKVHLHLMFGLLAILAIRLLA